MEALSSPATPAANRAANGQPDRPTAPNSGTEYVILQRVEAKDGGDAWRVVDGANHGGGSDAAIRKSRDGHKGGFKAVPVRNWKGGLDLDKETREVTVTKPIRD